MNTGYKEAAKSLKTFHNINISENTVREMAQREGRQILEWERKDKAASEPFIKEKGVVEFTTDGVMVNTYVEKEGDESWREMKVAIVSKRDLGDYATPETMDKRTLPAPKAAVAIAAIENCEKFTARWTPLLKRLHVFNYEHLNVLADGAVWIWNGADKLFRIYKGCLDVYHANETMQKAIKGIYEKPSEQKRIFDQWRAILLNDGWPGIRDTLLNLKIELPPDVWEQFGQPLYNYLSNHTEHLDYKRRLAEGLSIGSGQIEGANKQLVTKRLKQTGARWRIRRVNRMVALVIATRHDLVNKYWKYCRKTGC